MLIIRECHPKTTTTTTTPTAAAWILDQNLPACLRLTKCLLCCETCSDPTEVSSHPLSASSATNSSRRAENERLKNPINLLPFNRWSHAVTLYSSFSPSVSLLMSPSVSYRGVFAFNFWRRKLFALFEKHILTRRRLESLGQPAAAPMPSGRVVNIKFLFSSRRRRRPLGKPIPHLPTM